MKRPLQLFHEYLSSIGEDELAAMDRQVSELSRNPSTTQWLNDPDPFGANWQWLLERPPEAMPSPQLALYDAARNIVADIVSVHGSSKQNEPTGMWTARQVFDLVRERLQGDATIQAIDPSLLILIVAEAVRDQTRKVAEDCLGKAPRSQTPLTDTLVDRGDTSTIVEAIEQPRRTLNELDNIVQLKREFADVASLYECWRFTGLTVMELAERFGRDESEVQSDLEFAIHRIQE